MSDSLPRLEPSGDQGVAGCRIIEMHLREMSQLFDSLDHSPFREKDLDRNAEEYIVESLKELPSPSVLRTGDLPRSTGQPP